jgi:hypothetical protein
MEMKKILLWVLCIALSYPVVMTFAGSSKVTIEGSAYFQCNLIASYMKKHGYHFIEESVYQQDVKTNLYAARDADVIVQGDRSTILATGSTDARGRFSLAVPPHGNYHIVIRFHGKEHTGTLSGESTDGYRADLGHFSSDTVGRWIDARLGLQR